MALYPGQRTRRSGLMTPVIVALALAVGLAIGWSAFGTSSSPSERVASAPCPGDRQDAVQRARAAGCLLDGYLAAAGAAGADAHNRLAILVVPEQQKALRGTGPATASVAINQPGQPVRYARVTGEYASVVAVKAGTETDPDAYAPPDVGYTAWVAIVVTTADETAPTASWYLGHFSIRWVDNRWWLSDGFHIDEHASPTTYGGAQTSGFGPGWTEV